VETDRKDVLIMLRWIKHTQKSDGLKYQRAGILSSAHPGCNTGRTEGAAQVPEKPIVAVNGGDKP